ncbi:hypothetical protein V1264_017017 [Littorina saxatilis]|uniref:Zinc finger ZPR1-type domain-containing protein n=1 Tax=Littorina saxatilis TaxID=31220 RepID=A0AAN9BGF0_9CAEN
MCTHAPNKDPQMTITHYERTREQNIDLGIVAEGAEEEAAEEEVLGVKSKDFDSTQEVMHFPANCPRCNVPCETNMKVVNIPHFKEVVIMATNCESCGHRDNEVKSGGGMEAKGRKISLRIENRDDMSRDILKSETCSVMIPELDFETEMGTLGGKFTTVEGLLEDFKTQLKETNPFMIGDSSTPERSGKLGDFCKELDLIVQGEKNGVHFILDDPAGNSYIQSLTAPDPDAQLTIEDYERSFEQNEDLGLNDMKTENYEEN